MKYTALACLFVMLPLSAAFADDEPFAANSKASEFLLLDQETDAAPEIVFFEDNLSKDGKDVEWLVSAIEYARGSEARDGGGLAVQFRSIAFLEQGEKVEVRLNGEHKAVRVFIAAKELARIKAGDTVKLGFPDVKIGIRPYLTTSSVEMMVKFDVDEKTLQVLSLKGTFLVDYYLPFSSYNGQYVSKTVSLDEPKISGTPGTVGKLPLLN